MKPVLTEQLRSLRLQQDQAIFLLVLDAWQQDVCVLIQGICVRPQLASCCVVAESPRDSEGTVTLHGVHI